MLKYNKTLTAIPAIAFGLSLFAQPALALPRFAPQAVPADQNMVVEVQRKNYGPGWRNNRDGRRDWRWRRHHRDRDWKDVIIPGIAGAIIGGAIANAPRYDYRPAPIYRGGNWPAHVAWCDARYRSYRAWDNTFQPYNGPRKACNSPYA